MMKKYKLEYEEKCNLIKEGDVKFELESEEGDDVVDG
jgi:hypothetical protein